MMIVSMAIAGIGILLAYRLYIRKPELPGRLAARYHGAYEMIANKYWVDELYNLVFVGPIIRFSVFLWRGFDNILVDGTINGIGAVVRGGSETVRRLQTGNVQSYALSIVVGIVFMIGYFVFNGR
jgi:NADH-quinone oxidoreductase subunit L